MTGFAGVFQFEAHGEACFEGAPAAEGGLRVYGGHTLTQALLACFRTVPAGWDCYSLQSQFMRMAKPAAPIVYRVERSSDSRNFAVRRITADQAGRVVMTMTASFQSPFGGDEFQSVVMPYVQGPETLLPEAERFRMVVDRMGLAGGEIQQLPSGIDARWDDPQDFEAPTPRSAHNRTWLRLTEEIGPDVQHRQLALAFCSDFAFLETALRPMGFSWFNPNLLAGTLDHAIWFHRPSDMRQWHLCASTCPSVHAGRGFVRGEMFDPAGGLVASIIQEGILRLT